MLLRNPILQLQHIEHRFIQMQFINNIFEQSLTQKQLASTKSEIIYEAISTYEIESTETQFQFNLADRCSCSDIDSELSESDSLFDLSSSLELVSQYTFSCIQTNQ
ncbi:Hypothetical_protein [Hexamita inflata]|uniref:Hypothetical_protein n=1 Tax=Hexamita inflata TaxID=28002 RepID=A0AA86UUH5_9EUKA|nr:Hypothetical protein HINF_LOCUS52982 [Hexamita inflata]